MPLLLADMLSANDFGVMEYALAGLGFVVNAIISLGVPGGYPFFILKQKEKTIINGFLLHPLWLLLLFIINQGCFYIFDFKLEYYMALNVSYIIANQVFYSTQLKSHENPSKAIFLDSGVYLVLALLIVSNQFAWLTLSLETISFFIVCYAGIFGFTAIYKFIKGNKANITVHYKTIINYSINVMLGTFLIFLITSSGRILAEYFFSFNEVAIYGFYFRLSAIVVMVYQMINIIYFKKIYTLDPTILDKYYSLFFLEYLFYPF